MLQPSMTREEFLGLVRGVGSWEATEVRDAGSGRIELRVRAKPLVMTEQLNGEPLTKNTLRRLSATHQVAVLGMPAPRGGDYLETAQALGLVETPPRRLA